MELCVLIRNTALDTKKRKIKGYVFRVQECFPTICLFVCFFFLCYKLIPFSMRNKQVSLWNLVPFWEGCTLMAQGEEKWEDEPVPAWSQLFPLSRSTWTPAGTPAGPLCYKAAGRTGQVQLNKAKCREAPPSVNARGATLPLSPGAAQGTLLRYEDNQWKEDLHVV